MENKERSKNAVNEDSFDVELTGKIGEKMYFLNLTLDKKTYEKEGRGVVLVDESNIQPVTIYKILYKSGFPVIMEAIKETGERITFVQEMFFSRYEDVLNTIKIIQKIYEDGSEQNELYELFEEKAVIKYRYVMKFAMERYDIILNSDSHYTIKDVEATIDPEDAKFFAYKTDEHIYLSTKKIINISRDFIPFIIKTL